MTVLRVNDRTAYYQYLVDYKDGKLILYWPDYNSMAFNKKPHFLLSVGYWNRTQYKAVTIENVTIEYVMACPPFRYEGNFYRQYSEWEIDFEETGYTPNYAYVSLSPVIEDLSPDREMEGCQGMLSIRKDIGDTFNISVDGVDNSGNFIVQMHGQNSALDIKKYIIDLYCPAVGVGDINISYEIALVDEEDIFYHYDSNSNVKVTYKDQDGSDHTKFEQIKPQPIVSADKIYIPILSEPYVDEGTGNTYHPNYAWQHNSNDTFVEGLSLIAIVKVSILKGDVSMNIDFKSAARALTMEFLGEIIASMQRIENITMPPTMIIEKPRLINRTIQQVVKMDSTTDSKSNIVQPMFFRVRDLGSVVVHPEVTENICINLDSYKSQVTLFYIKIEGMTFPEIGRTESGVIFKIQGSLLPGVTGAGSYYILNEDGDLVTTGKYIYDY